LTNSARRSLKSVEISVIVFLRVSGGSSWVGGARGSSASCFDVQGGGSGGGEEPAHGVVQLGAGRDADAGGAAQLRERGPVRVVQPGVPDRVVGGQLLLGDLAERVVVQQHVLDRDAVPDRGGDLHRVLPEAAVAGDGDDRAGRGPAAHARARAG
jgi:hypothetical protein